jgi:glycosyltransferase involved in cell wall biosynthesis
MTLQFLKVIMTIPVLFLAPVPDFKGGAERSLMDLMSNPGVSPHLAVPAEGPLSARAAELGIPWAVVDFGGIASIRRPFRLGDGVKAGTDLIKAARAVNALSRRWGTALVHSNGLKAHAIALAARRLGGRPVVIHIRDIANTAIETQTWKAFRLLSDRTILVSRACWPGSDLPANAHVVYNGFAPPERALDVAETSMLQLGFAGRIHPDKGLHVLLDALAVARGRGADLRLVVRGAFAPETPAYEPDIKAQIARLGLNEVVAFEGFVAAPEKVYEGVGLVCVPSTKPDPLPRSVMEAMGYGLVVVASSCGGIPEMITDGETGFIADDAPGIADALCRAAADPELRARMGRKARERCLSTFTLDRLYAQTMSVYRLATIG